MNGKVVTDVGDAMYAIQGAMAIRRQRQMRENRRLSQVRMSTKKGSTSTPRGSDAAASAGEAATAAAAHYEPKSPPKTETSQTAFFLGIVFILLDASGMMSKVFDCIDAVIAKGFGAANASSSGGNGGGGSSMSIQLIENPSEGGQQVPSTGQL